MEITPSEWMRCYIGQSPLYSDSGKWQQPLLTELPVVRQHFDRYFLPRELVSVAHFETQSFSQATQAARAIAPVKKSICEFHSIEELSKKLPYGSIIYLLISWISTLSTLQYQGFFTVDFLTCIADSPHVSTHAVAVNPWWSAELKSVLRANQGAWCGSV